VAAAVLAWLWTARSAPDRRQAAPEPAAPARAAAGPAAPAVAVAAPRAVPAAPPPPAWQDVPLAARLADLGPLARHVDAGLRRARAALQPCFDAADREAATRPRPPPEEGEGGAAIVTLLLETGDGELRVAGAPLQSLGTSSPALASCCEEALRGMRFPAPGARPGQRFRLNHQLSP
jgi:hypothetical protein